MKIKSLAFLSAFVCCFPIYNSFAAYCNSWSAAPTPGNACCLSVQYLCPAGCYCPGNQPVYTGRTIGSVSDGCNANSYYGEHIAGGAYRCPKEFPKSKAGAQSMEYCYKGDDSNPVYYKAEVECKAGYYLPKGEAECKPCSELDLEPNEYCPKGKHKFSATDNVGIKECPSGKVHSEDFKECVSDFYCEPGYYLPKGSNKCEPCQGLTIKEFKKNQYCPGGDFELNSRRNQGFVDCPTGKLPTEERDECKYCPGDNEYVKDGECEKCEGENMVLNENKTQCIKLTCPAGRLPYNGKCTNEDEIPQKTVNCEPGYYIKAKKEVCDTQCTGLTKYCPGGEYPVPSSTDRGIYNCPGNGSVNSTGDACNITLTADQMMYGPMGKVTEKARQCWQYHNNISNYVKCLFGKEVQKSQKSTTQTTSLDSAASDTNSENSETTQDTNING